MSHMPERELRRKLEELHAALHGAAPVDPESQELLREIQRDVQELLERSEGGAGGAAHGEGLAQRLRDAVARFEETHPTLTEAAGRVIDQLAKMGI
jgi:hypothetical protein